MPCVCFEVPNATCAPVHLNISFQFKAKKTEQVLFCKLTQLQRKCYQDFLHSNELESILAGKRHVLYGIDILRKICNRMWDLLQDYRSNMGHVQRHLHSLSISHTDPDLIAGDKSSRSYGAPRKSGKLQVTAHLLSAWHTEKHRALLFCQTRQMLDIVERNVQREGWNYLRMDGNTPVARRMSLIDKFNGDASVFVFLLTTKVGGLGVNLTGADRVLIVDPSWNPSTDEQARERAWRLGQQRDVAVFRLLTSGR